MWNALEKHVLYSETMYPRRQMRDTLGGTVPVKNSGELYLPMPSSFLEVDHAASISGAVGNSRSAANKLLPDYLPWNHPNPAYKAYLQRARFPDMTANAERAMLGIATKTPPEIELPSQLKYLEEEVSVDGESLAEFYAYCLSEALGVGKVSIVVDIDKDTGEFYLTTYTAETNINWKTKRSKGSEIQTHASFVECDSYSVIDVEESDVIEYVLDDLGNAQYARYKEGNKIPEEQFALSYRGKPFKRLPVFNIGASENTPKPGFVPLMGISDIAIACYQEDADIRQAHFLTCNPTLFIFGISKDETPSAVGSQIIIGIKNPQGNALYPKTDTSALTHINDYIQALRDEAASYGANFLTSGGKESGEALNVRQANRGASLVHCVNMVSKGITDALKFIAEMKGADKNKVVCKGNTEFAEMILSAQDITALMNTWLQGGFDHDTFLDNMRDAGYVDSKRTNEQIKAAISVEKPIVDDEDDDDEDEIDPKKKEDEIDPKKKEKEEVDE